MRTSSGILIAVLVILTFPIWIGLFGAVFGLAMGAFGVVFGIIGSVFGAIFGIIGGLFGAIFGVFGSLIGWVFGGFPFWGSNIFTVLVVVILVALVIKASQKSPR